MKNLISTGDKFPLDLKQGQRFYFIMCPGYGNIDWRSRSTELLIKKDPECLILCPYGLWEKLPMEQASYNGSIIFWLSYGEQEKNIHNDDLYNHDLYGQIGRWSIKSSDPDKFCFNQRYSNNKRVNVVIGAEKGFPGLDIIQKDLDEDHGKHFPIYSSLEETIDAAVELAEKTNPKHY